MKEKRERKGEERELRDLLGSSLLGDSDILVD